MSERRKPSKFDLRREATRESLLALGFERFPIKGYSATSIEDILRDSPHGRGGFYFHFAGKEEFFLAVQDYRDRVRGNWWEVARDPSLTTIEEVIRAGFAQLAEIVPGPSPWGILLAEFWQSVKNDEVLLGRVQEYFRTWQRELTWFCEELAARDMLRTDIEPQASAEILHAMFEGYTVHALVYGVENPDIVPALARLLRP